MNAPKAGPSPQTLRWIERELSGRVIAFRRLPGGIVAAVHEVTVEHAATGRRDLVVLRHAELPEPDAPAPEGRAAEIRREVEREAGILAQVQAAGLPAPRLLAASLAGAETGGLPAILMSRVPGAVDLTPADPERWLDQIAETAVLIHEAKVTAPPIEHWIDREWLTVPAAATRPDVWRGLASVLAGQERPAEPRFIHRDYQHFNLLWADGKLTGVVDWGSASCGPPDIDAGHCRLNLAVLFDADLAERFRLAYEARAGRQVDPWWDLYALASYNDWWPSFIPGQVAGRAPVDGPGMTARVEDLIESVLRRI